MSWALDPTGSAREGRRRWPALFQGGLSSTLGGPEVRRDKAPQGNVAYAEARDNDGAGPQVRGGEPDRGFDRIGAVSGEITSRVRLRGLLRFYYREAA